MPGSPSTGAPIGASQARDRFTVRSRNADRPEISVRRFAALRSLMLAGSLGVSMAASAATTVSGPNPDIAQGTAFAASIGPANVRVTITETVAGDVFGPGKTGTIRVNLGNIGVLNGVGSGAAPCAGTFSLSGSGPVIITITAAPAGVPVVPCAITFSVQTYTATSVLGPVTATIDAASTLPGVTVGASATIATVVTPGAIATLSSGAVPANAPAGAVFAVPNFEIDENSIGAMFSDGTSVVELVLPPGHAWASAGSMTSVSSGSNGMAINQPQIDPSNSRRLVVDFVHNSSDAPTGVLQFSGQQISIPAGAASGPLQVAASIPLVSASGTATAQNSFTVATVTSSAAAPVPTLGTTALALMTFILLAAMALVARKRRMRCGRPTD